MSQFYYRIVVFIRFLRTNIIKSIYANFRLLPLRQAIKMPIFVYGRFLLREAEGVVIINGDVSTGMIKIGRNDRYPETRVSRTIWVINGRMVFNGPLSFFRGSYIMVARGAELCFGSGDHPACGANTRIICFNRIVIEDAHITWDCQIMDSSFHYIEFIEDNSTQPLTRPIHIGKHVWVGNRTTISAGAIIPDETIVASHSLVNRDFSEAGSNCLIAGIPAKVMKTGIRRIYDWNTQKMLDQQYNYDRTRL
jgi:acetyltransferase-like isoleucine patch superfamily enzyme